jgi:hypothetical protein
MLHTTAAIPALFRVKNNRTFAFFRTGYEYVHLAYVYTSVTAITDVSIEYDGPAGTRHIGNGIHLFLVHDNLLVFP